MKQLFVFSVCAGLGLLSYNANAQSGKSQQSASSSNKSSHLYLDVHHLGAGKVNVKGVAEAHQKDLAIQGKYGVNLIKYWLDTAKGDVYCLASCADPADLRKTHAEAHGLLPDQIFEVKEGQKRGGNLYLDFHQMEAGKLNAKDVAEAHRKDLAVQKKYGVNLLEYWVDEKKGTVRCLALAPDSSSVISTHREAHGLIPSRVVKLSQGQ